MKLPINDENYESILLKSIKNATDMLSKNSEIYNSCLPESIIDEYQLKNSDTIMRLEEISENIQNKLPLDNYQVSYVNRALLEYIDTLEVAQSHYLYMTDSNSLSNIEHLTSLVRDVYISQMRFNQEAIDNRIEQQLDKEVSYDIDVIVKALDNATDYLVNSSQIMAETLKQEGFEDLVDDYLERNKMPLYGIEDTKNAIIAGSELNVAQVCTVNKAMTQYIQKLEVAQSNMAHMLISKEDISVFKSKIENVHFQTFKFNSTFPVFNVNNENKMDIRNRQRPNI